MVLPKYKTVIFVHGCFWHRHEGCKDTTTPKTRTGFWEEKFRKNVENDKLHMELLNNDGCNVIVIWECEIEKDFDNTMNRVVRQILERN